jgi:ATP-binding cassette subfamily F protein 3
LKTKRSRARKTSKSSIWLARMLFRGDAVKKKISVLSGGERARLCLAGLLLGSYNVLVLDEPGNHLDVDTVEALAEALIAYQGTVVFTSHDRHFMSRVATCIIEVREGRVVNYRGDYNAYVYSVNKEVEEGDRQQQSGFSKPPPGRPKWRSSTTTGFPARRSIARNSRAVETGCGSLGRDSQGAWPTVARRETCMNPVRKLLLSLALTLLAADARGTIRPRPPACRRRGNRRQCR